MEVGDVGSSEAAQHGDMSSHSLNQPSTSAGPSHEDRPPASQDRGITYNFHDYIDLTDTSHHSKEQSSSDVIQIKQEPDSDDGLPDGNYSGKIPHGNQTKSPDQTAKDANDGGVLLSIKTEPPDDSEFVDVSFSNGSDNSPPREAGDSNGRTTSEAAVTGAQRSASHDLSSGLEGYLCDSSNSLPNVPFSTGVSVTGSDNVYYTIRTEPTQVQQVQANSDTILCVPAVTSSIDLPAAQCTKSKKSKHKHKKKSKSADRSDSGVSMKHVQTQIGFQEMESPSQLQVQKLHKVNQSLAEKNKGLVAQITYWKRKATATEKQLGSESDIRTLKKKYEEDLKRVKKQLKSANNVIGELEKKLEPANDIIEKLQKIIIRLLPKNVPYFGDYNINNPQMLGNKMRGIRHIIRLMFTYGLIPRLPPEDQDIVPHDFFELTFTAMEELLKRNHPNIVYKLSAAICMKRENGAPLVDLDRMPYAMLEGTVLAILSTSQAHQSVPYQDGYKKWLETQSAWFGDNWHHLFRGPVLKYQPGEDTEEDIRVSALATNAAESTDGVVDVRPNTRTVKKGLRGTRNDANEASTLEDIVRNTQKEFLQDMTQQWHTMCDYGTHRKAMLIKDTMPCVTCMKEEHARGISIIRTRGNKRMRKEESCAPVSKASDRNHNKIAKGDTNRGQAGVAYTAPHVTPAVLQNLATPASMRSAAITEISSIASVPRTGNGQTVAIVKRVAMPAAHVATLQGAGNVATPHGGGSVSFSSTAAVENTAISTMVSSSASSLEPGLQIPANRTATESTTSATVTGSVAIPQVGTTCMPAQIDNTARQINIPHVGSSLASTTNTSQGPVMSNMLTQDASASSRLMTDASISEASTSSTTTNVSKETTVSESSVIKVISKPPASTHVPQILSQILSRPPPVSRQPMQQLPPPQQIPHMSLPFPGQTFVRQPSSVLLLPNQFLQKSSPSPRLIRPPIRAIRVPNSGNIQGPVVQQSPIQLPLGLRLVRPVGVHQAGVPKQTIITVPPQLQSANQPKPAMILPPEPEIPDESVTSRICEHKKQRNKENLARDQMFVDVVNKLMPADDDGFWKNAPDLTKPGALTISGNRQQPRNNALCPSTVTYKTKTKQTLPNATVQVRLLKEIHEHNPKAKWWLKAGFIEVENNLALRYSGKDEFIGDEDLGDGAIQQAEQHYRERKKLIQGLGVGKRTSTTAIRTDAASLIQMLQGDNAFIKQEIQRTEVKRGVYKYEAAGVALREEHDDQVDQQVLMWKRLLVRNEDYLEKMDKALQQGKKARLSAVRTNLLDYNTTLTTKKRTLGRYIVVFMISDEMQHSKPYSWPVRLVPMEYITSDVVARCRKQLIDKMAELKMSVVGCLKDEWTSHLEVCDPARPVCITQLIEEARQEAASIALSEVRKYFAAIEWYSNTYVPELRHNAVPEEDVMWLNQYVRDNNVSIGEALKALHKKLLPKIESPHPWQVKGKPTLEDQYYAIMAIYLYRDKIASYGRLGVDFTHHAYVPAIDPVTRQPVYVKEIMQQLFKNIAREAKEDSSLSKEFRTRLSKLLEPWFKASVNKEWTSSKCREANEAMLQVILDSWIPGMNVKERDYTQIDVNRPIDEATYLSEEMLTSLLINLETDLQRACPHPWATTAQDLSIFISIMRHIARRPKDNRHVLIPTLLQTICVEFNKAIDPDLEYYYYWTDKPVNIHRLILNLNDLRVKNVWTKKHPKFAKKRPLEEVTDDGRDDTAQDEEAAILQMFLG